MMIPDYNGGASAGAVNPDKSETIRLLRGAGQRNLNQIAKSLPLYWGPQPFTAGPMYMGAITIFLFVLGLSCISIFDISFNREFCFLTGNICN